MAQYFLEEIVREILLKLPVKSLLRFNSVNKEWRSIIESPTFASDHLAHINRSDNNSTGRLLALKVSDETYCPSKNTTAIITACLAKQETEQACQYNVKSFDEYTDLMTLPQPCAYETGYVHPHSTSWGFGFDSRTNDCKVVKIDSQVQIFSLATGSWKSSRVGAPPACSSSNRGPQPFINGAIHWLASIRIGNDANQVIKYQRQSILSFDISNEIFREIMLPKTLSIHSPKFCSITEYGKSLALCVGGIWFNSLWVMKEYGAAETWTQVLNHNTLVGLPKPLGFSSSGAALLKTSYVPKCTKIKTENARKGAYCFAGSYVESLVLLNQPKFSRKRPRRGEWMG
ncbi:F-box/kelch-repeat protein At2g43270-like [Corylus avellana]|uniref:F-box/kelch-repeat protein At2g43270-like n=1 Tax=Corylus avellana TaxID=13451 RepID=UPI00286D0000|nr:F-box/kelch-repeat protein At2g43270-like [Corylus avellana]